ncbi:MAG: lysophospholipid acyltransferase family protein [Acidobacteriia bacterium]|nr:lysophospholipid acyltransferase family protein [Terriglobia bacterium]
MPSEHFVPATSPPDVLSRVAQLPGLPGLVEKLVPVDKVRDVYRRVRQSPEGFRLETLLSEMRVELRVDAADSARVPVTGSVVVVANHPFGVLDGAILTVLLTRVRPDVKVVTNFLLGDVPELKQHCIFVDPFETDRSIDSNRRALKECLAWLQQGGMLALFPAGEVSHLQVPEIRVADPAWNDTAARLVRRTGASALPVYFCGRNSVGFQILGMIHPRLRTALLMQEFLQQEGKTIEVRVGSEIPSERISGIEDDREATEYLRWRTYLLGYRSKRKDSWTSTVRSRLALNMQQPVAAAVQPELLAKELAALSPDRSLTENGDFAVFLLRANEGPHLQQELGRLREVTFRQVGEGTGRPLDLDRFDLYYWHLLLWHKTKQELVGAYRAGSTAEILPHHGVDGLYTSTLFRYDPRLFERLGPALELGRSFVRPEYQRQYAPLLLLWKGIARFVAQHPETPTLFGAVSISNDYSKASREMIYRFFEARRHDDELAGMIEPRSPFRPERLRQWDCRAMCHALRDLDELSQPIADVETDGKGLPILIRQYAKVGGKILGFNVDRKFSNVLDGLVVVDLRQTVPCVLERYMGREGLATFRDYHQI